MKNIKVNYIIYKPDNPVFNGHVIDNENAIRVEFNFNLSLNTYYQFIINDDRDEIYSTPLTTNGYCHKEIFFKFFKYKIKLLSFDINGIKIIDEINFDVKNHNFTLSLKSESKDEIEIWKNYISLVESTLNIKINHVINSDSANKLMDIIEISRDKYELSLDTYGYVTDDYSSLAIIKNLFNILNCQEDIDQNDKEIEIKLENKNSIKIIGCYTGIHDQGVCLIEDNKILACYSEERFSRIKSCFNHFSFPKLSLEALQKDFNIDIKDPNIHLVSAKPLTLLPELIDILNYRSIKLYDHHYSHACGAYYTSGFDENTLIVSYDGGDSGEDNFIELNKDNLDKYYPYKRIGTTHAAFHISVDGKLIEIDKKFNRGSLANIWYWFCGVYGFVGCKDEGKIMGLAAQGKFDEKIYNQFNFFVKNDCCTAGGMINTYYIDLLKNLSSEKQLELKRDLAYNLQKVTEDSISELIDNIDKQYGPFKNLCLAGGIFANVKLNQKINEQLNFENVWVYPAMSDEGLSLGSAIAHGVELGVFKNRKIENVFFGKNYSEKEINNLINNFYIDYKKELFSEELNYNTVADLLINRKIIGLFDGAAEYGPRALGNRSIIVEPTKKETHEYLNRRLNRNEIMPFAPIIMEEYINNICYYNNSNYSSDFMTMCYNVREEWLNKIPAVINIYDATARPQVVNKKRHKHFHNILYKYHEKTGIPVLMNTSFNSHGEPIINSPSEALNHLAKGTIDYLIINNKILHI